jgi:hypothetical protein
MTGYFKHLAVFAMGILSLFFSGVVHASYSFNYGDFSGSTIDFLQVSESTSTEDVALYNQPSLVGNQQLFFPTAFFSESSNGLSDTTSGTLTMTLRAHEGYAISKVTITEIGNATLEGNGGSGTSADLATTLTVYDQTATFAAGPYTLPDDSYADFVLNQELDFSGLGVTEASFSLVNLLTTSSETGTTAKIQKQVLSDNVMLEAYTNPVPIPGAALLFATGGLLPLFRLIRSRRR